ncbi:hypothetical protein ASPSYDRAFT_992503 [Aspergillus sydowii CBS 593.65]|uniref:CST complex subunit Stn1 N-terminal domain-containing protein n=1 Tax=Aspergillus sydowii CBS 593.65 TaxID=1036612 RepID=A0A1L9THV8_9EURO|nr:uncharacterized protein ASPSYDRAFT_992503 [Aspergillus sydowii CBS 593.65]OJJ59014.1 hypothetical protein ASPSYDRAFT_992503 [Aspergillus sydowii CBS 593.65]
MATNDTNNNAAKLKSKPNLTFYPAFCFRASRTNFIWVKIGAADVHRLKRRVEFGGEQGLFFYQNHPIRFVNLVGVIVARSDVPRRTILTLDDSTGATVDIVVLKGNPAFISTANSSTTPHAPKEANDGDGGRGATPKEYHVTSTTRTPVDITPLQPGRLFQIKGTLSVFRATMQVQLERFFTVPDTKAEMRFVEARCRFLVDVLSVPWVLGEGEIAALRVEADEEGSKIEEEHVRRKRGGR